MLLDLWEIELNLEEFADVPEPLSRQGVYRLSITKDDTLRMNEAFRKKTQGERAFRLRMSRDGRRLILDTEGTINLVFSPSGARKHHELGKLLRQRGLELPASFVFTWLEKYRCWVGQYEGLSEPPAAARKRRKAA